VSPFAISAAPASNTQEKISELMKKAEAGDPDAQVELGKAYRDGNGVPQDYKKAFECVEKSAKQGYARGQHALADCYYRGYGVAQNPDLTLEWLEKATAQNFPDAFVMLGELYWAGLLVKQDKAKAKELWSKAAEQDCKSAFVNLGIYYCESQEKDEKEGLKNFLCAINAEEEDVAWLAIESAAYLLGNGPKEIRDHVRAHELHKKGAELRDPAMEAALGVDFLEGWGTKESEKEAVSWLEKASEAGNGYGQGKLALHLLNPENRKAEANLKRAFLLARKSAEQDDRYGQLALGYAYGYGWGCEQDPGKSKESFRKAGEGEKGLGEGKLYYGYCLLQTGIERAERESGFAMIKELSDQGYVRADLLLAEAYATGNGTETNLTKAFEYAKKVITTKSDDSAHSGDDKSIRSSYEGVAYCLLGGFYRDGIGCKKDLDKSLEEFQLSAELGNEQGQWALHEALREMVFGAEKNPTKAIPIIKQLAQRDDAWAAAELAHMYARGSGTPKDAGEAFRWASKSAATDEPEGSYFLGWLYEKGIGCESNLKKALYYYNRAADRGRESEQETLIYHLMNGIEIEKDTAKGFRLLKKAAEGGSGWAQKNMARCYIKGECVEKNPAAGFEWASKAATNNAGGKAQLAYCYEEGIGCKADLEKAEKLYDEALAAGEPDTELHLALVSMKLGHHEKARPLFERTAKESAEARAHLGWMYAEGVAGPKDIVKAYRLLSEKPRWTAADGYLKKVEEQLPAGEKLQLEERKQGLRSEIRTE
jgi:TPR repeat protein